MAALAEVGGFRKLGFFNIVPTHTTYQKIGTTLIFVTIRPFLRQFDWTNNAFYYAMRSANIDLIDVVTNEWPGDYFAEHVGELDEILSRAYEELKLKNVLLSEDIEIFVENKLIDLRFFSDVSRNGRSPKSNLSNIKERVDLVIESVNSLKVEFLNAKHVNEKFLFVVKFVAQNIHILKQQLKSTYIRLPWEEMEFYLVSFVSSFMKPEEINLFYCNTLNKGKTLNHLGIFAKRLEDEKYYLDKVDIDKFAELPKLKREKVIAKIISNYPEFKELYNDYQQIRDIYSLQKIGDCIKWASSANPKQKEGQLTITRALQVMGEYLKNTLESPNLSNTTGELLLLTLPKNTREIITSLRDSLSHANSLSKRTEIENKTTCNVFICIVDDIKKVGDVIIDIFYDYRFKMVKILLEKIVNSKNLDEINEISEMLSNVNLDELSPENLKLDKLNKIENLVKELSDNLTDKTYYEKHLFTEINNIISAIIKKSENIKTDYVFGYRFLKVLSILVNNNKMDFFVRKTLAKSALQYIAPQKESHRLEDIDELLIKISSSARLRMHPNIDEIEISLTALKILFITEFQTRDIYRIDDFRTSLNDKHLVSPIHKERMTYKEAEKNNKLLLTQKLTELKSVLKCNTLSSKSIEIFPDFKSNNEMQAAVEMLVLDIMSILGSSKNYLENNLLFLDNSIPVLTGKCLRNYIAHDNALLYILFSDPSKAVFLNAKKLISKNIIGSKFKIGKFVKDDPIKLKNKYSQSLAIINIQERMFTALKEGNLEDLIICLKKGADIKARTVNLWTSLHFAAEGCSLEVVKFILDQNLDINAKDVNNQTSLHIAAAYGRKSIVIFFVKEAGLNIDDQDKKGKTPLHFAANNGHKDVVEILINSKASIFKRDLFGFSPLHYAIMNNHIDTAKILLDREMHVDANESTCGLTPLFLAAREGHLKLVNFLLRKGSNVNARCDVELTPLHFASLHGHLEVVCALIAKGANVDSRDLDGCTPLHYAVEQGHKKIANILLKHGADVNATNKSYNSTPLHYTARDGQEEILKALLKNKANTNATILNGKTALHLAGQSGHLKIVRNLLENGVDICAKDNNNATVLHYAAGNGHKAITELLIKYGAGINTRANDNFTPLHLATLEGHKDITDLLIRNKAEVTAHTSKGMTPLHTAAMNSRKDIIDLLIKSTADVNARTNDGTTPLHLAARNDQEDTIYFLLQNKAEVNARSNTGFTPLHTAVLGGNKNIVQVLIANGAYVNIRDNTDITPLHMAVETGQKEIVEVLVTNGADVDSQCKNLTPLLSAIKHNMKEVVEILIANKADFNPEDDEPLKIAVIAGYREIVEVLLKYKVNVNKKGLKNVTALHLAAKRGDARIVSALIKRGADVDAMDIHNDTPLKVAAHNGHVEVIEVLIANGASVNAKPKDRFTPLHAAAAEGHANVVKVLLNNKVNVSVKDNQNRTPLEFAVSYGHLQVVKMLLEYKKTDMNTKGNDDWTILHIASQGSNLDMVKYLVNEGCDINAVNASHSKPIHIAAREGHKDIVEFFLSKELSINDPGSDNQTLLHYAAIKGHLNIVNRDNKTLVPVVAMHSNFSKVEQLKQISQTDISLHVNRALVLLSQNRYQEGLNILKNAFMKRREVLGPDNPGTLDIQTHIVNALYTQGAYQEALDMCEEILQKQIRVLGLNNKDTLSTRNMIALVLHRLGKDEEAIDIYQEVYQKQKEILGVNHSDTLETRFHMALVLDRLRKHDEALNINREVFEYMKSTLGANHPSTIRAQNNIAVVLNNKGEYEKALEIYKEVFAKEKEIFGINHCDTLRTLQNIAVILLEQEKYTEAIETHQRVLNIQKNALGENHPESLTTQFNLAHVYFRQHKYRSALKAYRGCFDKIKTVFGSSHWMVLVISENIEKINEVLRFTGTKSSDFLNHLQKDMNIAVCNGDLQTVQSLLKAGADINDKDIEGKTPLHYAVSSGHESVVSILLNNGADVTQVTNEGYTSLHTATSKSYKEIVVILLQHVNCEKLNDFINAKTASSSATSLQIAAKNGSLEIVKCLLKYGASYNIKNEEGKTALDLSEDQNIIDLLKLVEKLFEDAKKGAIEIISKLKAVKTEEFLAITNVRNNQGNTLLQVAIINKHKNVSRKLLEMLKSPNQNL